MDTNETVRENGVFNLAYEAAAHARSWAGPIPAAGEAKIRATVRGGNDVVVGRSTAYYLNRLSVATPLVALDYAPLIAEPHVLIHLAHQQPPGPAGLMGQLDGNTSRNLGRRLTNFGIDSGDNGNGNSGGVSNEWSDIIRMAATAAPLGLYAVDLYRTAGAGGVTDPAAAAAMGFAFQRGAYSNGYDRSLITSPWHTWGIGDINRLSWLGVLEADDYGRLLAGGGYSRPQDTKFAQKLKINLPSPGELLAWGGSAKMDDALAARYGLDACSDAAVFWAKAQGFGADLPAIPNAPEGGAGFATVAARAAKRLPGLSECLEMQRRFRALPANPAVAMDGRSPPWSEQNTRDMLKLQGVPDPVANSLVALVTEPLNVRIVNEVLLESLKHPAVAAIAAGAAPPGVDWVAEAYLSHGVSDEWANTAAAAIRAKADDQYNEEKIANKRALRAETRRVALERYRLGNATPEDAAGSMTDEFFDAGMAAQAIFLVETEIGMDLIKGQLASLKKMYLSGGISGPQLDNQIQSLGVTAWRAGWYKQEWTWERIEGTRFASTGDILAAFKRGLLNEAGALTRLQNIGWSNADALLQVAVVEHDETAKLRAEQAAAQAKAAALAQKQLQERQKAIAATQKLAIETAKAKQKISLEQALAAHEALAARDKYYRAVHLQNSEYAAAVKKGDKEKQAALLTAELQEYEDYLIEQTKIYSALTGRVPNAKQIDTEEAPGPDKGASGDTHGAQSGGATNPPASGTATGGTSAGP